MNKTVLFIILTISTIIFVNCRFVGNKQNTTTVNIEPTGNLIEIDFQDSNYFDLPLYAKDTVTKNGWSIKYFVKDDSTRYNDIYIQCSKDNLKGVFVGEELLQYRRYFIPEFAGESDSYIYFTHGCATDCSAILIFSKDSTSTYTEYLHIVDYNLEFEQVLFVTDNSYGNEGKIFEMILVDLKNNKTHEITYNNIYTGVYKPDCIDTVIFGSKHVTIKTILRESMESEKEILQTRIVKL